MKQKFLDQLSNVDPSTFIPSFLLLIALFFVISLDFLTGCYKAGKKGKARTSSGFRKTVDKFVSYGGGISISIVFCFLLQFKVGESGKAILSFFNDGCVILIIYIELVSILENLIAVSPDAPLAEYLFKPLHKLFTLQLKNYKAKLEAMQQAEAAKP